MITTHSINNTIQNIVVRIIKKMFLKALKYFLMKKALIVFFFFFASVMSKLNFQQPLLQSFRNHANMLIRCYIFLLLLISQAKTDIAAEYPAELFT